MNKKVEFLIRVREQGRTIPRHLAEMAYTLAICVDEQTIPDDLDQAATRLTALVSPSHAG